MGNPYGIALDDASLRWAAAEGVSETVIAASSLLVDDLPIFIIDEFKTLR